MPGEHDQQRHTPVSVTRGSANIPKGEYESHGSAADRWTAEKQMNQLAGAKNYKDANKAGWFTVKIGDQYHIINTKKPAQIELVAEPPAVKEPEQPKPAPEPGIDPTLMIRPGVAHSSGVREIEGDGTPMQKRKVQEALMALPEQHQKYLFNVAVYDSGTLGENAYTMSGRDAVGQANNSSFTVLLAARTISEELKLTTAHETAHLMFGLGDVYGTTDEFRERKKQTRVALGKLWLARAKAIGHRQSQTGYTPPAQIARKMHLVSSYSACNPDEFRAESYSYYVHKPAVLKRKDPETYAILKDFFDGQEY